MTAMLKTCLSPTDGTRTNTLPSGYEMSRQVISCDFSSQNWGFAKDAVDALAVDGSRSFGWTWKSKLTLIWSTEAPSASAREVKKPSMEKTPDDGGHSSGGAPPLGGDCERGLGKRCSEAHGGWIRQIPSARAKGPVDEFHTSIPIVLVSRDWNYILVEGQTTTSCRAY